MTKSMESGVRPGRRSLSGTSGGNGVASVRGATGVTLCPRDTSAGSSEPGEATRGDPAWRDGKPNGRRPAGRPPERVESPSPRIVWDHPWRGADCQWPATGFKSVASRMHGPIGGIMRTESRSLPVSALLAGLPEGTDRCARVFAATHRPVGGIVWVDPLPLLGHGQIAPGGWEGVDLLTVDLEATSHAER